MTESLVFMDNGNKSEHNKISDSPELVNIKDLKKEEKITLLKELGYDSDGTYVLKDGKFHLDRYTKEQISIDNMFIFPCCIMILDNNPFSIISFIEEFGDDI